MSLLTCPACLLAPILAAVATDTSAAVTMVPWKPFLTPMPIWDYWFWTLLPLSIGIAFVYKTIKTADTRRIVRESLILSLWIVLGLIAAAGAIAVVVRMA